MLARFSVAYERFCRLLLTIFVVNIAMLVHTLLGAVVLGFFPSCAAAQTTFRTWLRAEDRSMRAKEVWGIFHGAWKNELKQANLFGWPLAVCWVVLAIDYYMMNWHARGTFDVAVSGVLFVLALVLLAFTMLVWVVRANYDEHPLWIVRTTLTMIVRSSQQPATPCRQRICTRTALRWRARFGANWTARSCAGENFWAAKRAIPAPPGSALPARRK